MVIIKRLTSPRGKGAVIIWEASDGRKSVMTDVNGLSDWPIRYSDGRIAYDYPERHSAYVKRMVRRAFDEIYPAERGLGKNQWGMLSFARTFDGWHSYDSTNRATRLAAKTLAERGLIELSLDTCQFRCQELPKICNLDDSVSEKV